MIKAPGTPFQIWRQERNDALRTMNMEYARRVMPDATDDEVRLLAMHKGRYECTDIEAALRSESGEWLRARLHSDGRLSGPACRGVTGVKVAIIPARGGSRRVPRKNVRLFRGKPMICYAIDAARDSGMFDLIVVSTDDAQIAHVAFNAGALVLPRPFDDGATGTQEIAGMVLDQLQFDGGEACVIYPTVPLLDWHDLHIGWRALHGPDLTARFAVSVGPDRFDAGCFYWGFTRAFRAREPLEGGFTVPVELPAERVCDINTPEDWARAELLYDALRRAP